MNFADISNEHLKLAQESDPYAIFRDEMLSAVHGCMHKAVDELTEEERFAIAFAAGVKLTTRWDEETNKLVYTTEPCGIAKINGQFRVVVGRPGTTPKMIVKSR